MHKNTPQRGFIMPNTSKIVPNNVPDEKEAATDDLSGISANQAQILHPNSPTSNNHKELNGSQDELTDLSEEPAKT
ncbi:MAG: hypothetical protein ACXVED_21380, partial [Bacteroidia bacterium]